MSFGRKGLAHGGVGVGQSAQLQAFLAAERSDRATAPEQDDRGTLSDHAIAYARSVESGPQRSMMVAYVLWWFGAALAAHRFYLRAYRSAFVMLGLFWGGLVLGGLMSTQSTFSIGGVFVPPPGIAMILIFMVWIMLDSLFIPGLVRRANATRPEYVFA